MIFPLRPSATQRRATCWLRKNRTFRLVSITASQSSSEKSRLSARRMMPALLTRMSTPPALSQASATTPARGAVEPRSALMKWKARPRARTLSPVSSASERPTATMSAPASARPIAMPCPMPVLAPVTRAQRPERSNETGISTFPLEAIVLRICLEW